MGEAGVQAREVKRRLAGAFQKSLWQGLKRVSCGASRESSSGCQGVRQELAYGRAAGKVVVSGGLQAAGGFAVQLPGRVGWALPLAGQLLGGGTVRLKLC